jgi:hypothetical protein
MSAAERLVLVDGSELDLSIAAQCRLLKVARSTLYYRPMPVSMDDLAVMRRMDELHLAYPFWIAPVGGGVTAGRLVGEPQTGQAADAGDGTGDDLPEAEHQPEPS